MNRINKLYQQIFGSDEADLGTTLEGPDNPQDDDTWETDPDALPIFVCSIALPDTKMPLHIFEPRYRLMIERCLQGSREFGVCIPTNNGYANIGTLLRIQKFWKFSDGRYFIETVGTKRFTVKEKFVDGVTNAQYNMAKVDWMADAAVEDPSTLDKLGSLRALLHNEVHHLRNKYVNEMNSTLARYFLTKLYRMKISEDAILEILKTENDESKTLYSLPTDLSALTWRILDFLPFPDDFKFRFLAVTNLQRRMEMMCVVLQSLRDIKSQEVDEQGNDIDDSAAPMARDQSIETPMDETTFEVVDSGSTPSDIID